MRYLRASNCNCTIGTLSNSSAIEWYGSCVNGYCDGYGTVNYYDPDGNYSGRYVGNVSQGLLSGFATRYYANGAILYQGRVRENVFVDEVPYFALTGLIRDFIIDSLLSGGIRRDCQIVKAVFSTNGDLQEIRFRISCYGQIVTDNYYTCTLVFMNRDPYVDMVNVNDNAQVFITLNFLRYAQALSDWFDRQSRNNR